MALWRRIQRLLSSDAIEVVFGDLEEDYRERRRRGDQGAVWAYLTGAVRSVASLAVAMLRRRGRAVRTALPSPREARVAFRRLAADPLWTLTAAVTLAVGIGSSAVVFSLTRALLVQPVTYRDAERVAFVLGWDLERDRMRFSSSFASYLELRERWSGAGIDSWAAYQGWSASLADDLGLPERVLAYRVSGEMFELLGVGARRGRVIDRGDARPGAVPVAVLSAGFAGRRFAEVDPVGRELRLDGVVHRVVGVMPSDFEFPVYNFRGDLWVPLQHDPHAPPAAVAERGSVVVVARLSGASPLSAVQARVDGVAAAIADDRTPPRPDLGYRVVPVGELIGRQVRAALGALGLAVAFVVFIACANVAGLLWARSATRRREIAVRAALGAGPGRLLGQLLSEAVALWLLGGVCGLTGAWAALRGLVATLPDFIVRAIPSVTRATLDPTTVTFGLGLSALTGMVFSLGPTLDAVALGRASLPTARGVDDDRRLSRGREWLVVGQVATALMLLFGAGLMVRSVSGLLAVDPGFAPDGVFVARVSLAEHRHSDDTASARLVADLVDELAAVPGIAATAATNVIPFSTSNERAIVTIEGLPPSEPGREPSANLRTITPGYFAALRAPLLGRDFDRSDDIDGVPVAIVDEAFAAQELTGADPIGRRIAIGLDESQRWHTIVGVAGDIKHENLRDQPDPHVYVPHAQMPTREVGLVVRSSVDADATLRAMRRAVARVAPGQPLYDASALASWLDQSILAPRYVLRLMTAFGAAALAMTAVGLFGLISYDAARRRREIGLRIALGAQSRDIEWLILGRGARLVAWGLAVGTLLAALVGRAMRSLLFGVPTVDPLTYGSVVVGLAATALIACYLPTRRARLVDPAACLRSE